MFSAYRNRKVFITGITGFKGSWLAFWLRRLGAEVTGYALPPPTDPSHFRLLDLDAAWIEGDVRDAEKLAGAVRDAAPEIVFHLAAQPLVRQSYRDPAGTFAVNVMGTLHLFEACRQAGSVRAIVNVTSDKCYENREWVWGYRENDPMGGYDPYSASKGCSELLTASYRNSYFHPAEYGRSHQTLLASCRAGNVIGGGDWAEDRLIPDLMRAVSRGETVTVRNPAATRPWQHVLEPLRGYLLVGSRLLAGDVDGAEGWNFGPSHDAEITVGEVVRHVKSCWDRIDYRLGVPPDHFHEAGLLKLDCAKARARLGWTPIWDSAATFARTVGWYREFYENGTLRTAVDLDDYERECQARKSS